MAATGIICLANDAVIDGLIALCESLRRNSPGIPVTVIPFDDRVERTRIVLDRHGFSLYDDPTLETMDELGRRYWPGDQFRIHTMRKFCAFWGPYERFFFLDSDVVVLRSLEPYFQAFSAGDLMYLSCDVSNVYRAGPVGDELVAGGAVGFNAGAWMGRRGILEPGILEEIRARSVPLRHGFVDNLEQTFLNYAIDVIGAEKVSGHAAVPHLVNANAMMRIARRDGGFVMADSRLPTAGRAVSLIHWAGYAIAPFMPHRRTFLTYRLAGHTRAARLRYLMHSHADAVGGLTWRTPVRLARRGRFLVHNRMASYGLVNWP